MGLINEIIMCPQCTVIETYTDKKSQTQSIKIQGSSKEYYLHTLLEFLVVVFICTFQDYMPV